MEIWETRRRREQRDQNGEVGAGHIGGGKLPRKVAVSQKRCGLKKTCGLRLQCFCRKKKGAQVFRREDLRQEKRGPTRQVKIRHLEKERGRENCACRRIIKQFTFSTNQRRKPLKKGGDWKSLTVKSCWL